MGESLLTVILNVAFWGGVSLLVADAGRRYWVDRLCVTAVSGFTAIVIALEVLSLFGQINRTSVSTLCVIVAALGLWRRRAVGRRLPGEHRQSVPASWLAVVVIALAASVALAYLLVGLTRPVEPVSDAPIYHLPFAVQWLKAGAITLVPTPFGEEAATYFPANGNVWLTWLMATSGDGPLPRAGQWPFLIVSAAALYGLARRGGATGTAAVLAAAVWTTLPIVITQSNLANVDLIWTAFYFIAVLSLLGWIESQGTDRRHMWVFALASGIVIGTKMVGAVFVLLLTPLVVVKLRRDRQPFQRAATLVGVMMLPAAFWYARGWWLTGNPVYPLELPIFGHVLFEGWYEPSAMRATAYHVPPANWLVLLYRLGVVAGIAGLVLILTSLAATAIGWVRRVASTPPRRTLQVCGTLAVAHLLLYWFVLPYNTQERFLMPALGLSLVPVALVATSRRRQIALTLVLLWQCAVAWSAAAATIVSTEAGRYPQSGFAARLAPGWEILERQSPVTGSTVAYTGTNLPYYLFGANLRNGVAYININAHPDWLPHDYANERRQAGQSTRSRDPWPQWFREEADFDAWVSNLRRRGVEFLFVARENRHGRLEVYTDPLPRFPIEKQWADAHPDLFVDLGPFALPEGTIPWVRVYRLIGVR